MKHHHQKAPVRIVVVVFLLATIALQFLPLTTARAAEQITTRSLTLQAGTVDGGSKVGGSVHHLFQFTLPSTTAIGSISFEYCTTAAMTCVAPDGIDTTNATRGAESGWTDTTIVKAPTTATNVFYLKKTTATGFATANTPVSYQILNVINPTVKGSFYVRINTYAATDMTGTPIDAGVVTAATAEQIRLEGQMPESLVFCVGEQIFTTSGVPDCANPLNTDGIISFNQLFSPTDTAVASSQMVASTNAGDGYSITVNGPTLTSSGNTILPMDTMGPDVNGTSQFGMNLKANTSATTPIINIGAEPAPSADAVDYFGVAAAGYDQLDNYKFKTGDVVATSNPTSTTGIGASNAQIFTVSYIANVPGKQAAGTYSTTLTYICTARF